MRRGACFRCGRYGHFARECFADLSSHTSSGGLFGAPAAPEPSKPPPLKAESWPLPPKSQLDDDRNDQELRILLFFLNAQCPLLVKMLLEKFGEYSCHGEHPTPQELSFLPLRGKLRELNEVYFQKGQRAEVVFSELDGSLCRVDLLNPEGLRDEAEWSKKHRCGDPEMELFMDPTVFPNAWWLESGSRFGIPRTLHRVSGIAGRTHKLIGVIIRIGRSIGGVVQRMLPPSLIVSGRSVLIIGPPNSGKTTVLRDFARHLSEVRGNIVVVVDKTCEIGGAADEPHASIGSARWQPVDTPGNQHLCMRLAVENMSPSTVIVDEISTEDEAEAARTISQRGVQLIATVHGLSIAELINDKERSGLLGGVTSVTLAKSEIRTDGKKQVMMRKYAPLFNLVLELRARDEWYVHQNVAHTVDAYLRRESFPVLRTTPGKAEPVTAVPTEAGFDYEPPLAKKASQAKTPFNFGTGPTTLSPHIAFPATHVPTVFSVPTPERTVATAAAAGASVGPLESVATDLRSALPGAAASTSA